MDTKPGGQVRKRSWLKTSLLGLLFSGLILLAVYTLGGFILLPQIARQQLVDSVSEQIQRRLTIQRIQFNPYTLTFDLEGVALQEADGTPLLSFQHLSGDVAFRNLLQRHLILESLVLTGPWVHLQIDKQGTTNLARLGDDLGRPRKTGEGSGDDTAPMPLTLRHIRVDNGQFWVTDRTGSDVARVQLLPIAFELNDITTLPDQEGPVKVRAHLPDGGSFRWEGALSLQPFGTNGRFSLENFRPGRIWAFIEDELNIEKPRGIVDISAAYDFQFQSGAPVLTVDDIQVSIKDISITRRGGFSPLIVLSKITLSDASYRLDGNRLSIGRLHIADGAGRIVRDHTLLNWQQIVSEAHVSSAADARPESAAAAVPWAVVVDEVQVEKVRLVIQDRDQEAPLEVTSGRLDLALSARASHDGAQLQAMVQGLSIRLSDIALQQGKAAPLLQVDSVVLHDGSVDLAKRRVELGELTIDGGQTQIRRSKDGILNWTGVWRPASSEKAVKKAEAGGADTWQVQLQSLLLADLVLNVQDALPEQALNLTLSPVTLKIAELSTDLQRPLPFDLSVKVKQGGVLKGKGELTPSTLAVAASLDIDGLTLLPLQSYLQPIARVNIENGRATLKGQFKRAGKAVSLTGRASVDDLRVTETETGDTLLGWKAMKLPRLALTLAPDDLVVEEILLDQPVGKFIIAEDQSNNWQKLAKTQTGSRQPAVATQGAAPTALFPVKIERVRIEKGNLDFADLSLPLKFSTRIHDLNGTIAGISSAPGAHTAADLEGRVAEYGVATIKGEVDPFAPQELTDIALSFRNLEMTNLTPYTAKFLGYRMDSGKLSVDLNYLIKDRQLQGDNRILLDKLTLGDKIESPDAIDAPLELAIALLQDSDGRIDLGLPVTGDLNDPQFSYGHLIWKAIGNLLTGIVSAPFRALGAAMGIEGDDLDTLVFEPGSSVLAPPEQEKLKTVSQILAKRPKLLLEIVPRFDPKADIQALQRHQLQVALLQQMGVTIKPGRKLDPISLSDARVHKAMESLYGAQFSAAKLAEKKAARKAGKAAEKTAGKETNPAAAASGEVFYKTLYQELLVVQSVPKQVLSELALQRGKVILEELTVQNKMPGSRVKLLQPVAVEAGTPDSVATRLELAPIG